MKRKFREFLASLIVFGLIFIYLPNHGRGYILKSDLPYDITLKIFPDTADYYDSTGRHTKMDVDDALRWMRFWEQQYPRESTMMPDKRAPEA